MPARPLMRSACALGLLLASAGAHALGLGQIRVLSGPGEPLVAEIPVVSNDPAELQALRASLASPETFTRIGLEPPVGAVADLRFATSADAAGRPVIRVTTSQPVTDPMLTFLVEVDWGQGRLVREYSALVATPTTVAAQPAVPVQAPQVQAPAVVERPRVAAPAPVASQPSPTAPAATPQRERGPDPQPPRPVARPAAGDAAADAVRVRAGDTLSRIASRIAPADVTAEQTMVGLLRANPQAFVGGDMNRLRSGSVLRVPAVSELDSVEAREAAQLVRSHARQWREARSQPQSPVATAAPARAAAPAASGGRLEIVPPGGGRAAQAGTQSGIAAGGEGEMLRQELQTTKETLAARDAELQDLKSRVAELERLQTDQRKLIALKDAELAAAQNRPAQAVPTAASDAAAPSMTPWLLGGALVFLGLLAAAWARRRRRAHAFRAPGPARPSIADAFVPAAPAGPGPVPAGHPDAAPRPTAAAPADAAPEPVTAAATPGVPSWERGAAPARRARARPAVAAAPAASPVWADTDELAPQVQPANAERLELAQAYLDLGDTARARDVLAEVEASDDTVARDVASRMRQGLG